MDKRTKAYKVKLASPLGAYHRTFQACWEAIPDEVRRQCTVPALVTLVARMKHQYDTGKGQARREAVQEESFYVGAHRFRVTCEAPAAPTDIR